MNKKEKEIIKAKLEELKSMASECSVFDFRLNHKSLYAWYIYQYFLNGILNMYAFESSYNERVYKKMEAIYSILEIDSFSITANGVLNLELEKLKEYANRM